MKQAKQAKQAGEDTFVFCPSFYQQLRAIKNNEVRLRLYESVAEYGVFGAVPDFTEIDPMGLMNGVFAAIKYVIDSTKSKRSNISNIRSNAGKNGGAPKGNQNARKQAKTSKTNKTSVDVDVDVDENIKKLSNESKESADKPRKRITQTIKSLFSGSFAAVHQPRHHHTNNVKHKEDFHRASRRTGQLQRRTKRFRDKEPADGANRRNKAQRRRRVGR